MEEMKKIKRCGKAEPRELAHLAGAGRDDGQNALTQAAQFQEAVDIDGVVVAKLDGTAKGGMVFAIADQLGVPICSWAPARRSRTSRVRPRPLHGCPAGRPERAVLERVQGTRRERVQGAAPEVGRTRAGAAFAGAPETHPLSTSPYGRGPGEGDSHGFHSELRPAHSQTSSGRSGPGATPAATCCPTTCVGSTTSTPPASSEWHAAGDQGGRGCLVRTDQQGPGGRPLHHLRAGDHASYRQHRAAPGEATSTRTAEFGILIGEKDVWGKGYGTRRRASPWTMDSPAWGCTASCCGSTPTTSAAFGPTPGPGSRWWGDGERLTGWAVGPTT